MKTFVIVKKDDLSIKGSYVADVKDDTSSNRSYLLAEPFCTSVEVPEGLVLDEVSASLSGDAIVLAVDPAKVAAKALLQKQVAITAAYEAMNNEVLVQMASVFGTNRTDSATAYKDTWELMAQSPADWETAGLKASFAVAGFAIGDALDTAVKVQSYAIAKVAEVKAYGIWRMQRIEAFKAEREAILAG